MKWNSQGENTKESEERAGNGDGGAMEKKQETEEEAWKEPSKMCFPMQRFVQKEGSNKMLPSIMGWMDGWKNKSD